MPRPRSDIQERITKVAREQFSTHGVDGASLRNIAKDAGTSIGMIYYYFPTKDDLFLAVVESVYAGALQKLTAALGGQGTLQDRVERLYQCFGSLTPDELQVLRLVVREALVSSERLERLIDRFKRGHLPLVLETVMSGMKQGELDPGHHPLVAMVCLAAIGALPQFLARVAARHFPGQNVPVGEELAKELAAIYLRGLGRREAPRRAGDP